MSMENPLTPAVIEPATFRFVAQHLNHCATARSVIYSEWVSVALGIQPARRMRLIVICGLSCITVLFYVISNRHDFRGKKILNIKCFVLILSTAFVSTFFYSETNWARYGEEYVLAFKKSARYSWQILMKFEINGQIFEKPSNMSFF